jgi:hypothetical protein
MYHYSAAWWPIFIFAVKVVIMLLTTVIGKLWDDCVFILPAFYVCVVVAFRLKMPYISRVNNWLSLILYGLNALFALFPVIERLGISVPSSVHVAFAVILTTVPILIIIGLFCSQNTEPDVSDPTRQSQQSQRPSTQSRYTEPEDFTDEGPSLAPKTAPRTGSHKTEKGSQGAWMAEPLLEYDEVPPAMHTWRGLHIDALRQDVAGDLGEPVTIPEGFMDAIVELEFAESHRRPSNPCFEVGTRALCFRVRKMYHVVDRVIDGSTVELLTMALNAAMIAGAIGFGWYVGALRGTAMLRTSLVCA